jgi:hypothetical protein
MMTLIEQCEAYNGLEKGDINGYPVTRVVCRKSRKTKGSWVICVNTAIVTPNKIYDTSDPVIKIIPQTCADFKDSSAYAEIVILFMWSNMKVSELILLLEQQDHNKTVVLLDQYNDCYADVASIEPAKIPNTQGRLEESTTDLEIKF